ncbi:MAG: DUF169 domain-containing protein [Candidatus Lokiarchaeota archaeon]
MNDYQKIKKILDLRYHPIGLKLVYENSHQDDFSSKCYNIEKKQRFSKYIKRVAEGDLLKLSETDTACISSDTAGHDSFSNIELDMKLNIRGLKHLLLFPVDEYPEESIDAMIIIITPHQFMKLIEIYVELYNKPMKLTTGASTGVCSEIVAYIIKREDVNVSFLCHGARSYAGFDADEFLFGIPAKLIPDFMEKLLE